MTLSSKNVTRYALVFALVGLITWMSASMLTRSTHKPALVGTVEITPLD